ncbi:CD3073 family putative ECF transporter S component [Clostridium aciditolerans]|uniref:ECF transporter S component n=1 Tax=Clostridium aciditolerans TaxID=339861 RepID=A0A934HVS3_9CLOT|nr:CD3073 family putative ECF transporter S component [Clostridium aciditolerans]MBI6871240.1 ECF transporter S component [Clostridium aciditolerans]
MKNKKTFALILCAFAAAINIVLGTLVGQLKIPLIFLDTIGTIFAAVYFGPWYGAAVGAASNIITGMIFSPKDIPFFLVNVVVGLLVGYIAKKYGYGIITAVVTGLILSVVCPLIGSPIAVWLYGGVTGSGNDFLVFWLRKSGADIFTSAFIPRITGNIIDKVISSVLVWALIKKLPAEYRPKIDNNLPA